MRSSSEGDVDGPLSESLEFELMEGGRSGLAGAWFDPCSKMFVVLALAGVFPVVVLLPLPEPAATPTLGGISSDSLDECVGGGLDKVLCSRLELDDSAAGRAPLEAAMTVAAEAECNDELRAVDELDETAAEGNSVEVVELGSADVADELEAVEDDDADEDCCCCNRYCCRNWIANRGNGRLRGS